MPLADPDMKPVLPQFRNIDLRRATPRETASASLTFGEGWHNNHHAHPQSSRHGLAWYEFDPNWYGISFLRAVGLAWDIKARKLNGLQVLPATIAR
jgi:fatty-acid desaturase